MEHKTRNRRLRKLRLKQRLKVVRRVGRSVRARKEFALGMLILFLFAGVVGAGAWLTWYLIRPPAETVAATDGARAEAHQLPPESRLLGTWQTDVESTVAERKRAGMLTAEEEFGLRSKLSVTRVTYTPAMITVERDDGLDVQSYEVIAKDGNSVTLKFWFGPTIETKKSEEAHIRFLGEDRYILEINNELLGVHLTECFRRVP